ASAQVSDLVHDAGQLWAQGRAGGYSAIGRRVGVYKITGIAGEGGMGTVYRARRADGLFDQEVAIKLVHRGFDTHEALDRFRFERQILARLQHPHIAHLSDGGTLLEEGREIPYLVMEFVDGQPITAFCKQRELSVTARLELFLKVCSAVQYAHERLIVHRDLKPSNIIVTADGVPKLLDFGVAQLLDANPEPETTIPFTPEYAAPEVIDRDPITAATDVYALGVVLAEMLHGTGGRSGDVEAIIGKARYADPAQRYQSVEQFAADIRRSLSKRPVTARPWTLAYRTSTFVQRNAIAVTAAALVVLSLLGGLFAATRQARARAIEAERAERRFEEVRTLANKVLFDVHDEVEKLPESTQARQVVVTTALTYLDNLSREAGDDVSLLEELATAYERVARVQGARGVASLGQFRAAQASLEKALSIRKQLADREPRNVVRLRALANTYGLLSEAQRENGDRTASAASAKNLTDLLETIQHSNGVTPQDMRMLANSYGSRADAFIQDGNLSEGLAVLRQGERTIRGVMNRVHDVGTTVATARLIRRIARLERRLGDFGSALPHMREAESMERGVIATDQRYRSDVTLDNEDLGYFFFDPWCRSSTDEPSKAIPYYRAAYELYTEITADANDAVDRFDQTVSLARMGRATVESDPAAGLKLIRQAVEIARPFAKGENRGFYYSNFLAEYLSYLALAQSRTHALGEARATLDEALTYARASVRADPSSRAHRTNLARTLLRRGDLLLEWNKTREARAAYEEAVTLLGGPTAQPPVDLMAYADLGDAFEGMANTTTGPDAVAWAKRNLRLWTEWPARATDNVNTIRRLDRARRAISAGPSDIAARRSVIGTRISP
ncbi:MAG TPA: serine/threonine-protein kinase, partial [Vicinamibacterales bacterium]|nr:serine/threonine-protein kinase [Vicinamibacterales bacterium]